MDGVKTEVYIQRCQRQKSSLKNEVSMKFLLYCDDDPRDLGIEDDQGRWDWDKFREHVEVCPACSRFKSLLGEFLLDRLQAAFGG